MSSKGVVPRSLEVLERLRGRYRRLWFKQAVIVAGLGRCGTTLVYRSLARHGFRGHPTFLVRLDEPRHYEIGRVYKTHGFPPSSLPDHVKLIYMFGNPMNIVISVHKQMNEWGRYHHKHLGSDLFTDNDCVFQKDTLLLSRHFDLWYRPQGFSFATVRYEALHEPGTISTLNDYLRMDLALPPFRERSADWTNHPRKAELLEIYGDLNERIEQADDIKIWQPDSPTPSSDAATLQSSARR